MALPAGSQKYVSDIVKKFKSVGIQIAINQVQGILNFLNACKLLLSQQLISVTARLAQVEALENFVLIPFQIAAIALKGPAQTLSEVKSFKFMTTNPITGQPAPREVLELLSSIESFVNDRIDDLMLFEYRFSKYFRILEKLRNDKQFLDTLSTRIDDLISAFETELQNLKNEAGQQ